LTAGNVFWYETNEAVGLHVTFVLTDLEPETGKIVIVHATDQRNFPDWTTVLRPGEHPRIIKNSVVVNKAARFDTKSDIESDVEYGRATQVEDCAPGLLIRIRDGVIESGEADEDVEEYCLDHFAPAPVDRG
jgi:hypothetical protein